MFVNGIILAVVIFIGYWFWKWIWKGYDLFEKQGIPFVKPYPILGSFWGLAPKSKTLRSWLIEKYNDFSDSPVFGVYDSFGNSYVLRDPELIKQIGVKDFDQFADHTKVIDEHHEPLFGSNLINLTGQRWKDMRATLSPMFTGNKMRMMFEFVSEICGQTAEHFKAIDEKDRIIEGKDIFGRVTVDVIATTVFGIQVNSLKNKDNEFYKTATEITNVDVKAQIRGILLVFFPRLFKLLNIDVVPKWKTRFFTSIIKETMETREKERIVRNDLIHLIMQLKKGTLKREEHEIETESFAAVEESEVGRIVVKRQWSDDELIAQCFMFFLAGFDTVSSAMSFVLHELAINLDIQNKLFEEVEGVHDELNGKPLNYDTLQSMKYIDMVISETLRFWPPAEVTDRVCLKDYKMINEIGEEYFIKKGRRVWFPIVALHFDPKYFENPTKFDPERFNAENRQKINPATYLPFGFGPRNCIGSRYALMQMKCALYYLVLNFSIEVCEKTQSPLVLIKKGRTVPEKGLWVELKPREK